MTTRSHIHLLQRSTLRSLLPAAAAAAGAMSVLSTAGVSAQSTRRGDTLTTVASRPAAHALVRSVLRRCRASALRHHEAHGATTRKWNQ